MGERLRQALLPDGSLLLDMDERLEGLVSPWVLIGRETAAGHAESAAARVFVHEAVLFGVEAPAATPTLRVGTVGVWLGHDSHRAVLGATERDCAGAVDLEFLQATLIAAVAPGVAPRLQAMLTLASALLMGRLGRALVSASAVIRPSGGAWLVAGCEGAGRTTTALRLASAGWLCVSAERAVLRQEGVRGVVVEGWPEPALAGETGWESSRAAMPAAEVEGVLLLRHEPAEPTRLVPGPDVDVLEALGTSSPWLRLDQSGASGVLRAMRHGLRLPVYELHLGLDTYANAERLADVLAPLPQSRLH